MPLERKRKWTALSHEATGLIHLSCNSREVSHFLYLFIPQYPMITQRSVLVDGIWEECTSFVFVYLISWTVVSSKICHKVRIGPSTQLQKARPTNNLSHEDYCSFMCRPEYCIITSTAAESYRKDVEQSSFHSPFHNKNNVWLVFSMAI